MPESRFVPPFCLLPSRLLCLLLALIALPALATEKPTVAVLYFDYHGHLPELTVLKKGLAQMIITDLSDFGTANLVERDRLQAIHDELELGQSKKFDSATAVRVGKLVQAHYIVLGGYFDLGKNIVVSARILDVETGVLVRGLEVNGAAEEFLTFEQKLAEEINQVLVGLVSKKSPPAPSSPRGPSQIASTPPPVRKARKLTLKTAVRYSRALDAKDRKDVETAKKELTQVLEEQPDFVLASVDLAKLMK